MEYKIYMKKIAALALVTALIIPPAYAPVFAPRAQALFGVGDVNIESIPQIVGYIFEKVGKVMARKMVDDMVQSTIKWANSGFDGNPAYPGDWGDYLSKTSNDVAIQFLSGSQTAANYEQSRSETTVDTQTRQAVLRDYVKRQYGQGLSTERDDKGYDYDAFMTDFNKNGGWGAFLQITQEDTKNPHGNFLVQTQELQRKISQKVDSANREISVNKGYLSFRDCIKKNEEPPQAVVTAWRNKEAWATDMVNESYPDWNPQRANGECIEQGPVKTPGGVIESKLNQALGAGLEGLITADDIDSLVSAFANGLLQRYVFGDKGLFADNSTAARSNEVIDIDGDRVPDGYDYDDDRQLDQCHHGLKNISEPASNSNCIGSKGATNSPFFGQICQASGVATRELEKYQTFLNVNKKWDPNYHRTWLNKTTDVQQGVEEFVTSVSKLEAPDFVRIGNNFGLYSDFLEAVINSLLKDKDMRNDRGLGYSFGGISGDDITIASLDKANRERLQYMRSFITALGQCEDPNLSAIRNINLPPDVTASSTESTTITPAGPSASLSCHPSVQSVRLGTRVTWLMASNYPDGTSYQWEGDQISVASTTDPSDLFITYETTGEKSASITAIFATSTPVTRECSDTVNVFSTTEGDNNGLTPQ